MPASRVSASAPVAAIRSQTVSAFAPVQVAQVELRQAGVALAREDQRQRDGAVEKVGAALLAGALRPAR